MLVAYWVSNQIIASWKLYLHNIIIIAWVHTLLFVTGREGPDNDCPWKVQENFYTLHTTIYYYYHNSSYYCCILICYYCVPIAVYHHEPNRRTLIELGIKIKLLIVTTTQSCSMHVCAIIVYVSYYLWIICYQHVHHISR